MASNCCLNHDPTTGGEKLHEEMAKAKAKALPYAFNLGGSNVLQLEDYKEQGKF